MIKNPDDIIKGLIIIFISTVPLLTIVTWLAISVFHGYGKIINSSLSGVMIIFYHLVFFELVTGFSVSQIAHEIALSLNSGN